MVGITEAERAAFRGMLDGSVPLPVSIWHHVRSRQLELGAELATRAPIYLDSRFWIDLHRASENDERGARARPLLTALQAKVREGRIFCPISASTFVEMLNHRNADVRLRTARLVDELSLGVSLVMLDELADAELEALARWPGDHAPDPRKVPIWTRTTHALGTLVPEFKGLGRREMLAIQVAGFDTVWRASLADVVSSVSQMPEFDLSAAAERITAGNRQHAHEATTFAKIFEAEAHGAGEIFGARFAEIIHRLGAEQGHIGPVGDPKVCVNVIGNLLALQKARQALRSLHIRTSLYAIIRLNKGRAFKTNDFTDLEHAVAGVGYAQAFFTERSLATAITQRPLQLDRLFGCFVSSDFEEAVQFVSSL